MSLRVLEPGLHSLPVDLGRPGSRSLGVPLGGAADRAAYLLGNALVGNGPGAVALEVSLVGPALRAEAEVAGVVFGAPFELASDRQRLAAGKTFTLAAGEVLRVGGCARGMRAYLCVPGGFQAPRVPGGGPSPEPPRAGDELPCHPSRLPAHFLRLEEPAAGQVVRLRVLPGAQSDWFAGQPWAEATYRVTAASNRMGLRLEGPPLRPPPRELVSEPVCPGSVQVTRDGQCIVLGVDGQTIGGYPKVAQVVSADLDRLGQLRPGDSVGWEPVSLATAEELRRRQQRELYGWLSRLRWLVGEAVR
jgi:biotin-dependent carboxylase-like uncharacterized protein